MQPAIAAAKQRLAPFEQRNGVSSEYFMAEMAAEDLEGGDEEYVQWADVWLVAWRLVQTMVTPETDRTDVYERLSDIYKEWGKPEEQERIKSIANEAFV